MKMKINRKNVPNRIKKKLHRSEVIAQHEVE
jgi:hypothetical protein